MNRAAAIENLKLVIGPEDDATIVETKNNFNKLFDALRYFAENNIRVKIESKPEMDGYISTFSDASADPSLPLLPSVKETNPSREIRRTKSQLP